MADRGVAHGMRYQVSATMCACATRNNTLAGGSAHVLRIEYAVQTAIDMLALMTGLSGLSSASQARALAALPAEPDVSRWMAGTTALREDNEVII
jgi:hypothetical protein